MLIVPGRLFETRFEMKERMTRKPEKEILDTSEFFRDEAVIDFYTSHIRLRGASVRVVLTSHVLEREGSGR